MHFQNWNSYPASLREQCIAAGARDGMRAAASIFQAVRGGMSFRDAIDSLRRNAPEQFRGKK
jgi:hypothetical protein